MKSLFSFIFFFSFGVSSSSLGSSINTGPSDRLEVKDTTAYHTERFEFYREMFLQNYEAGDPKVLEYAVRQALYHGMRVPVDSSKIAIMMLNLGRYTIGEAESEYYARQGLLWARRDQHDVRQKLFNNLGLHWYRKLEMDSAFHCYTQSLKECEFIDDPCYSVKNNIAQFYQAIGYYEEANQLLTNLVVLLRRDFPESRFGEDSEPTVYLTIYSNLAKNYVEMDRMGDADALADLVKTVLENNPLNTESRAEGLSTIAIIRARQGRIEAAQQIFAAALTALSSQEYDFGSSRVIEFFVRYADFIVGHPELPVNRRELVRILLHLNPEEQSREHAYGKNRALGMLYLSLSEPDSASYFMSAAEMWKRTFEIPTRSIAARLKEGDYRITPTVRSSEHTMDVSGFVFWLLCASCLLIGVGLGLFFKRFKA